MYITATEFKANLGKYLTLVVTEDILITKNGKPIAKLSKPTNDSITDSLIGIIPNDSIDLEKARTERLLRHENIN